MSANASNVMTLTDWAKGMNPDGSVAQVIELLSTTNELLDDMPFMEGNLPTGTRVTVRTGLPDVYWRLINQGVPSSKSTKAQVDESTGMLEAWSEVDTELIKLNGNSAAYRMSEARAFIEAMNQEMAYTTVYGNGSTDPEEFNGLAVRYSDLSATNAQNIVDFQGSGAAGQMSIWLVAWGAETVHGLFPKGSSAGLLHEDYGEQTVTVTNGIGGTKMRALQERFQWKAGLVVKDWRYVVRGANIDVSDLGGMSPADLVEGLENMVELLPNNLGRPVIYGNRTFRRYLRKQVREAVGSGGGLTFENFAGKRVLMFGDIPIRRLDTLLNTEDEVT
jgi:hypothetical protein